MTRGFQARSLSYEGTGLHHVLGTLRACSRMTHSFRAINTCERSVRYAARAKFGQTKSWSNAVICRCFCFITASVNRATRLQILATLPSNLPGLDGGNMRAFAAMAPCQHDGGACESGSDCCCGFCRTPTKHVSSPRTSAIPWSSASTGAARCAARFADRAHSGPRFSTAHRAKNDVGARSDFAAFLVSI